MQWKISASTGLFNEALDVLSQDVEGYRLNFEALLFRGLVYPRVGSTQAALGDFELAIWRRPKSADARAALGITLFGSGQVEKGLETLNEAVRLDGPKPQTYFRRGQLLLGLGMAELARRDFRQTIRYQAFSYVASSADPWVGLATAELAPGNREEAALALAESRTRTVRWVDEPTVLVWLEELERELGASPSN